MDREFSFENRKKMQINASFDNYRGNASVISVVK